MIIFEINKYYICGLLNKNFENKVMMFYFKRNLFVYVELCEVNVKYCVKF